MHPLSNVPFRTSMLLLAGLLLAAGLSACTDTDADDADEGLAPYTLVEDLGDNPSIVAVVESDFGADTLTTEAFEEKLTRLTKMFPEVMFDAEQAATIKAGVVDQFLFEHLITGEAGVRNVTVDPALIEQQMMQVRSQMATDSAFAELVSDMSEDSIRAEVTRTLLPRVLFSAIQDAVPDPSEADVAAYQTEQAQQVRVQHILLLVPQDAEEAVVDSVEALAELLIDSLDAGVDFGELARRHSQDPGSAPKGGDLGFFRRGQMVKPFDRAAFALEDTGEMTDDPVRTSYGFHILRLLDRREEEVPVDQARSLLLQKRKQEIQQDELNRLRSSATLHVNPQIVDPKLLNPDR